MTKQFIKFFSDHGLNPRPQQTEVLSILEEEWDNYKYFLISAPVGVGKTHIALSVADALDKSYLLTSTIQLQEQYENHSSKVVNLKGKGNYVCRINSDFYCDSAPCVASREILSSCKRNRLCPYYNQRDKALMSQMMITNYTFFLYSTHCGALSQDSTITESGQVWKKRDVIIMDEAHELENHLISFSELKIDLNELKTRFGIKSTSWLITNDEDKNYKLLELIFTNVESEIASLKEDIDDEFNSGGWTSQSKVKNIPKSKIEKIKKLNSKMYFLDKFLQRLKIYFKTKDDGWIVTPNTHEQTLILSPLTAQFLFEEYMEKMADKFIFMSATPGSPDVFCKELGLDKSKVKIIEVGTPFDPLLSPIYVIPAARLSYKEIDKNIVNVLNAIDIILETHSDEKGIIHSGNYRLAQEILKGVDPTNKKRLIARDMNEDIKLHNKELLKLHFSDKKPTVLVSPSMTTGVDLADEYSRFQIIVKLPFLSLGDPRVKYKADTYSDWYNDKMFLQILQASGRSTRNEEDYSMTYILDAAFPYFYDINKKNLPKWFKDRLIF